MRSGRVVDEQVIGEVLAAIRALVDRCGWSSGPSADKVSITQYRVLVILSSCGPRRIGDLAVGLRIDPSSTGRLCDRLVHRELVGRQCDPADRRAALVAISAHGREVLDEITSDMHEAIAEGLSGVSDDEQRTVLSALSVLSAVSADVPHRQRAAPPG